MTLVRIMPLRFASTPDWARATASLERAAIDADVRLVGLDDAHGLFLLEAADADALARAQKSVDRWLKRERLVADAPARDGTLLLPSIASADETTDEQRVAVFVSVVRASGCVWGLRKKTWARSSAGNGREALPLWPDEASAEKCIVGEWSRYRARPIALAGFVAEWLPGMVEDGIVAVVLPTPDHDGAVVSAAALLAALRDE